MDRRKFLKATGVSLALPMLESIGKEKQKVSFSSDAPAKRLVCVG